ncbi:MAG: ATP-binding cassette domain-containing protein [Anaerolineae bacterium]
MIRRFLRRDNGEVEQGNGRSAANDLHLIDLKSVVKAYETPVGDFIALRGIDLQVDQGEFVAVIGKSGSGKTTLINMLTGIDRPTSGTVHVANTAVHTLREGPMAEWRGRNVGVIFQFFQLLPMLSCIENVMLPMDFCDMYTSRERKERALHLLDQVGLIEHAYKLPSEVSGGQQQRVAIARAMANDPPILVADEPTGNLDSQTAIAVIELFEELVDQGKTILMVTHDNDLAKRVSRTVIISDGEIIDEYLAKAFPALTEAQLVRATRKLEPQAFAPGAVIVNQGDVPDKFYIVTKGIVEVLLQEPDGQQIVVARLRSGQYFGEIALLRGGARIATVRASTETAVEVATLDETTFKELMGESPVLREEVARVAGKRAEETEKRKNGK